MSEVLIAVIAALIAIVIGGGCAWWRFRYTRGVSADQISRYAAEFAAYAGPGGVLYIQHEGSKRMLQFAQCEATAGRSEIEFGFPDMAWSESFFDALRSRLTDAGLRCHIELPGEAAPVRRFLTVRVTGTDEQVRGQTDELVRICLGVMGLDLSATFKLRFMGNINRASIHALKVHRNET